MILLGLHGPAQSGKDTTFEVIQQWASERGAVAVRRGFADLLKQSAYRLFKPDATVEEALEWTNNFKFDGELLAIETIVGSGERVDVGIGGGGVQVAPDERDVTYAITGREFLQRYGTESHRDVFGHNFWVDQLIPTLMWQQNFRVVPGDPSTAADIAVITDVRFDNEAQRIRDLAGHLWRLDRPSLALRDAHVSEITLPDKYITQHIVNDYPLEVYAKIVRALCDQHIDLEDK